MPDTFTFEEASKAPESFSFEEASKPTASFTFEQEIGDRLEKSFRETGADKIASQYLAGQQTGQSGLAIKGDPEGVLPLYSATAKALNELAALPGKAIVKAVDLPANIHNKYFNRATGPHMGEWQTLEGQRVELPRIPVPPTAGIVRQIASGTGNVALGTAEAFVGTPESGLTLPLLGLNKGIGQGAALLYGATMASNLPNEVNNAIAVVNNPNSTVSQITEAIGAPVVQAFLAKTMLSHAAKAEPIGTQETAKALQETEKGTKNATEIRQEPVSNQPEHIGTEAQRLPPESGGGNRNVESGQVTTPETPSAPREEPPGAPDVVPTVTETTKPVPEKVPDVPSVTGKYPAVREVSGDVVVGKPGETHPDIIKENDLKATDIDQRGFVNEAGEFQTREQVAAETGLPTEKEPARQHSTDLPEAKAPEPVAPAAAPEPKPEAKTTPTYGTKYFSEIGSFRGAIKVGNKWVGVKNLNTIDKTGWVRLESGSNETPAMTRALSEPPIEASDVVSSMLLPKRKPIKTTQPSYGEIVAKMQAKESAPAPVPPAAEATAVSKVEKQIKSVAKTEGQRPAKEVKNELVSRLEKAIEKAPNDPPDVVKARQELEKSIKRNRGVDFAQKNVADAMDKAGIYKTTIDIPGDGVFTIYNTKEALTSVLERAKRINTSSGEATKIRYSGTSKADKAWIQEQLAKPPTPEIVGMGGAAAKGEPAKPQLAQLTDSLKTMAASKTPQAGKAFDLGESLAKAKDTATSAMAGLKAAAEYSKERLIGKPVVTEFKSALGERHLVLSESVNNARKFVEQSTKAVPNPRMQEAIADYIDAGGDDAILKQSEAETPARYKAGYAAARNLTPEQKTLADNIRNYFESRLQQAKEAGVLEDGIEDYIHRIYERESSWKSGVIAELRSGIFTGRPGLAKQRTFHYDFEAEKAGYKPIKSFIKRIAAYDLSLNKAIADRQLIKDMMAIKMSDGRPMIDVGGLGTKIEGEPGVTDATLIKPSYKPKAKQPAYAKRALGKWQRI